MMCGAKPTHRNTKPNAEYAVWVVAEFSVEQINRVEAKNIER